MNLIQILIIGVGGAIGGIGRFWLSGTINRRIGGAFPWGTLVVNVTGSLAIGLLAALLPKGNEGSVPWLALVVGILGSYTTVSSFSLETLTLARNGQTRQAVLNIVASLLACLGAAAAGYRLGHGLMGG